MPNHNNENHAAGQSPRKSSPLKRSDPVKRSPTVPPLSVKDAAEALLRAVANENGTGFINRVVVTRNFGPRIYIRSSLCDWRDEAEPRDHILASREREEFSFDDDWRVRNDLENPEQAYRRGYQQGAGAVYHALDEAHLLSERLRVRLHNFVYGPVKRWRFMQRLGRHLIKDAAPKLKLSNARRRP